MILVAIGIFAVLAFIFCIYIEKTGLSVTLTTLALLGLVVSSVYAVKNWQHHYGLEQYTTTTTRNIYSVSPNKQMSMILYQPIGSKTVSYTHLTLPTICSV